jgi:hypothetical protein
MAALTAYPASSSGIQEADSLGIWLASTIRHLPTAAQRVGHPDGPALRSIHIEQHWLAAQQRSRFAFGSTLAVCKRRMRSLDEVLYCI